MALFQQIPAFDVRSLVALPLVLLVAKLLVNKYGGGLNAISGPFLAGSTDLWRVSHTLFSDLTTILIHLHRKSNSAFVRIGPRVVSVADPDLIDTIYGIHSKFRKTEFYSIIDLWHEGKFTHSLFESRDEEYHARIRKPIAHAYSMTTVRDFEPAVDSTVELLMSKLDRFVASGESLNLEVWLQWYTFDVLGEILFSRKLGFLDGATDVEGIVAGTRFFTGYWQVVGQVPMLDRFLLHNPLMLRYGPDVPMLRFAVNRLKERAARRDNDHTTKRDFLARCIEAQAKDPDVVTDRMVVLYLFNNIGAGSDTTATTLTSIFYYLLKNPASLQKLVDEINRADNAGHLSECVTWQEAGRLAYFQACVKEALRMHPPIGMILERYVPQSGIAMGGQYFPAGTIVGINAWVLARNQAVYGADCDTFRPERWLEAPKDKLAEMERANFAFGHGSRGCIGKNIAMLEMSKLVPQLLRHYQFSFARPDLKWKVRGGWFVRQEGVEVIITKRVKRPIMNDCDTMGEG